MKREELKLGMIVYRADVYDAANGLDRVAVSKYVVTKAGEFYWGVSIPNAKRGTTVFGGSGRYSGVLESLQPTPIEAVEALRLATIRNIEHERKRLSRLEITAAQHLALIAAWKETP